jgi:methyltransferase (TIGR00027 family)
LLDSDPETVALVAPGAAQWCWILLSTSAKDCLLAASAAWPPTRFLWRRLERLVQPGIIAHYWHRKHWIEQCCREALAAGCQRVVVAGAGFDTLALRLAPQFPQIEFVEIDHPATQREKRAAMAKHRNGLVAAGNLSFISADFGTAPLPISAFDDGKRTLLIMEGLLMYLAPTTVEQLFAALGGVGSQVEVVFSFMVQWEDGSCGFRPRSRWVERWLASREETFTWSTRSASLQSYLRTFGLSIMKRATTRDLAALYGSSHLGLEGEELVLARN